MNAANDKNRHGNRLSCRQPRVFLLCLPLCAMLLAGIAAGGCASHPAPDRHLQLMQEAWGVIENNYVEDTAAKRQEMTYGAIEGMVDSLGDEGHSTFLPPAMAKALGQLQVGKLKGIGVQIQTRGGRVVVVAPLDGSPAERAGVRAGDIIVKVGDEAVADWPLNRVIEKIGGPPGSAISLTLEDPKNGDRRVVRLKRAAVVLHEVSWSRVPGTATAHVRLASFDYGVGRDLKAALKAIAADRFDNLILDLRNNPGGLLSEAVEVASQFLESGEVLLSRNAQGQTEPVHVIRGGLATRTPMLVLVNEGTASAAEIVAGALQDASRARLVGNTTFGTGTVLKEFKLSDGSALLLAVEEWLTPQGRSYWHKGIRPDVLVTLPAEAALLSPREEKSLTPPELRSSADLQLLTALQFLRPENNKLSTVPAKGPARY